MSSLSVHPPLPPLSVFMLGLLSSDSLSHTLTNLLPEVHPRGKALSGLNSFDHTWPECHLSRIKTEVIY